MSDPKVIWVGFTEDEDKECRVIKDKSGEYKFQKETPSHYIEDYPWDDFPWQEFFEEYEKIRAVAAAARAIDRLERDGRYNGLRDKLRKAVEKMDA